MDELVPQTRPQAPDHLLIGAARVDITPPAGVYLAGYGARSTPATGVHDTLWAAALVADDGAGQVALITADLVGVSVALVQEVREALAQQTGLPAANIFIAASHTHSGPEVERSEALTAGYRTALSQKLQEAGSLAWSRRRPAVLRGAKGTFFSSAKNRRPDGGPIDPDVSLLRAETPGGELMALLVNYTCHGTVLGADNLLISADYIGAMRRELAQHLGAEPVILFINGALGNINPGGYSPEVSMIGGYIPHRTFADAERLGASLAARVLEIMARPEAAQAAAAPGAVGSASRMVELPLKPRPAPDAAAAELARCRQAVDALAQGGDTPARAAAEIALAYATMEVARSKAADLAGPLMAAEIQALRLGDAYLLGIPGEPFNEIGTAIKQGSGLPLVLVCGLANGYQGYFPTAQAYPVGGYEPAAAKVKPGADTLIVETALSLLEGLH